MKKHAPAVLSGLLLTSMLTSCEYLPFFSKDEGFSKEIENFVPQSTIDNMTSLGMLINEGKVPPDIEGVYLASEFILKASNVPDEDYEIGSRFIDYKYFFYGQDNKELTIDFQGKGISYNSGDVISESTGSGAFLSGYGNDFTVFLVDDNQRYEDGDTTYSQTLLVISGTISDDGIEDFHEAIWMLDDYGDPADHYIPVNSGRVFHDSDGLAERQSSFKQEGTKGKSHSFAPDKRSN